MSRRVLVAIIAVLVGIIVVLTTALAYAQDFCGAKPPRPSVPLEAVTGPQPHTSAPVSPRTESTLRATERRGAASAVPAPFSERHNLLLCLAVLVGVAVGRRTTTRVDVPSDAPPTTEPEVVVETTRPVRPLGAVSVVGAVRESNQDRAAVREIAGLSTILVADGLGGMPRGGEAAEIAITYALKRLEAELPAVAPAGADAVRALLLHVLWGAGVELARAAARTTWIGREGGLRTTLILVVGSADSYVTAWIGDGGVDIIRADGSIDRVLEPHKDVATPDVLNASLGPATDGKPSWAIAPRQVGDVLAVATDGIADVFDEALVEMVVDALRGSRGDTEDAAQEVVDALAGLSDDDGNPIHTDNLTLALLTTKDRP